MRDDLRSARHKIETLVVGLDFCSTSPTFLRQFQEKVRIGKANGGRTFHPKVYVFEKGESFTCIVGSSNLTGGGFGGNTELNLCVTGGTDDDFIRSILGFIGEQEAASKPISVPEIDVYEREFTRIGVLREQVEAEYKPVAMIDERDSVTTTDRRSLRLDLNWTDYLNLILRQEGRCGLPLRARDGEIGFLGTVKKCQEYFRQAGYLDKMSQEERKFVGGTSKEGEWFGNMSGSGQFTTRLNRHPKILDAALNEIPLTGEVTRANYEAFTKGYDWTKGVGTASRLLAMKRPDLFVCLNRMNRSGLAGAFAVTAKSLKGFDGYWSLASLIWKCPWWLAPRPVSGEAQQIWDARVALLDTIYYEI